VLICSQELLKHRDLVEQQHDSAQDTLAKREAERQKVQNSDGKGLSSFFSSKAPEVLKQEKLDNLARQITEAEEKVAETEKQLQEENTKTLEEFDAWHKTKVTELTNIVADYVDSSIEYHSKARLSA
jgi:hypothetical protein